MRKSWQQLAGGIANLEIADELTLVETNHRDQAGSIKLVAADRLDRVVIFSRLWQKLDGTRSNDPVTAQTYVLSDPRPGDNRVLA
mgnify:CR=1 FL=1